MPEHYTSNTTAVLKFCPTCNRKTMHRVYNKRLGSCMEPHVKCKPVNATAEAPEKQMEMF